jgi:hypothetical protein
MQKLPLMLVLLMQGSALAQSAGQPIRLKEAVLDFPRSRLQLKTTGPVSLDVKQGTRAAYGTLAEIAGLNIVFDPDFRDSSSAPPRIENADVLQAFDLLSAQSGSFVEVLNSNTIIVTPDNPTKRRDYEFQVLKTFYLPNGASPLRLTEMITTVRTTSQARYVFSSQTAQAIVIRDTPSRVALAEKTIGVSMPLITGAPVATMGETIGGGHILTLDSGAVRDSAPSRSKLNVSASGPVSLDMKDSTRATFETLARAAGLNVIFDPDFRSQDAQPFKVDNLAILDAIDVLALQTRTFWEPIDNKTIMVAPDNQTKRRNFQNVLVKTFYLPNASQVELVEIVTALRTLLNARYLATVVDSNAIVIRDTPNKVALAEAIISDLRKAGGLVSTPGFPWGTESGFVLNRRAAQTLAGSPSPLQSRVRGPLSFDANDSARSTYESVAATAGLRLVFDNRFKDLAVVSFKLQDVDIVDALDFLSLQTQSIWQMMDNDTILVAPDNPSVRADLVPRIIKTISLTKPQQNINEIVTLLRTILGIRQISPVGNSIVMEDTGENIAFAEKIVSDLERPGTR